MTRQTPAKPFHAQAHAHPFSACTNNPLIPFNNKTKSRASFALSTTPSTSSPSNRGSVLTTSNPTAPVSISNHPSSSPPIPSSSKQNLNLLPPLSVPSILNPRHVSQNLNSGILCLACASRARWCAACASRRWRIVDCVAAISARRLARWVSWRDFCEVRVEIAVCISDFSASSFCKVRAWECEAVVRVEIWERWVRWVSV
jgi:hypothetical protein